MQDENQKPVSPLDLIQADEETQTASERALIANALDDPARAVPIADAFGITGDDFGDATRGVLFNAVLAMFAAGEAVDAVTVGEKLNADESVDAIPEISKCLELGDRLPFHFDAHCRNVLRRSMRRRVGRLGESLASATEKPSAVPERLAAKAVEDLSSLLLAVKGERTAAQEVAAIVQDWTDLADNKRDFRGAELPTPGMNRALGRLEPGLHILAAKTSAGKSTVEAAIVRNLALCRNPRKRTVLRCFLDMGRRDLLARDLAALLFLDLRELGKGHMGADERAILPLAAEAWNDGIDVHTLTAPTLPEILSRARALHADKGLDLLTVDFVQNVQTGNPKTDAGGNANARIGEATKALKTLGIELGLPVLLLSQLNRGDRDETRPPVLSDLRDSGNIEQDARTVAFVHPDLATANAWAARAGVQSWRDLKTRPVWFTVAKNQQGGLYSAPLRMQCDRFGIEDADRGPAEAVDWEHCAPATTGAALPVIARDAERHVGAFDPRFLPLVNAAAEKTGKPKFEVVETVKDGLQAVADRLAHWRARK